MLKNIGKYIFMIELGAKYFKIFKKTFFHPFIALKSAYEQLSHERQNYSQKVIDFLNLDIQVVGNIPTQNKILYVINHRSLLDIIVIESIFANTSKNGAWIAKQALFDAKLSGKFFEYSGCISVDLDNKRGLLTFFKKIKKTLAKVDNMNIYMFPEGERFDGEGITEFQTGAAKIAKANKLTIIPVYISGKNEELFKATPFKSPEVLKVHFGEEINHATLEEEYTEFYNSTLENA